MSVRTGTGAMGTREKGWGERPSEVAPPDSSSPNEGGFLGPSSAMCHPVQLSEGVCPSLVLSHQTEVKAGWPLGLQQLPRPSRKQTHIRGSF